MTWNRPIFTATLGLALAAAAGCAPSTGSLGPAGPGTASPPASPSPTTPGTGTPTAEPTTPSPGPSGSPTGEGTVTYEVWFTYGEHLFVTSRTGPFTVAVGRASVEALLDGPTSEEAGASVGSAVPDATELLDLTIEDGTASVDLSGEFESGGGTLSMRMRLAQVVWTLTQFESVDGVAFEVEGQAVEAFGGEGIVLDGPQTRADFEDLLPAILIESPLIGAEVGNPVTISGTANVFEATVSIRILDEDGDAIVTTFTNATCGTGCRGDYSASVRYEVDHDQSGTVMVFEASALDGTPQNVVSIPVVLSA